MDTAALDKQLKRIKSDLAAPMLKEIQEPVSQMLGKGDAIVSERLQQLRDQALQQFDTYWENEARRLKSMQHQGDIGTQLAAVQQKLEQGRRVLQEHTAVRLDALRIMIAVA